MGEYIYRLASPKQSITAIVDGQPTQIGVMKYLHKPAFVGFTNRERNEQIENKAEKQVEREWKGVERPELAVLAFGGKIGVGYRVYKSHGFSLVSDDGIDQPKYIVGYLTKVGRQWKVETNPNIAAVEELYATRNTAVHQDKYVPVTYKGSDPRYQRGPIFVFGCWPEGDFAVHIYDNQTPGSYMVGNLKRDEFDVIPDKVPAYDDNGKVVGLKPMEKAA